LEAKKSDLIREIEITGKQDQEERTVTEKGGERRVGKNSLNSPRRRVRGKGKLRGRNPEKGKGITFGYTPEGPGAGWAMVDKIREGERKKQGDLGQGSSPYRPQKKNAREKGTRGEGRGRSKS